MKTYPLLLPCLSLALMLSCSLTGCGQTNASAESSPQEQVISTSVETQTLTKEKIEEYKTISSTIWANNEVAVIPKVSGTVANVHVQVGDTVQAGDLLFEIDSTDLQIQVKSAESSVSSSQASISSAEAGLDSAKEQLQTLENKTIQETKRVSEASINQAEASVKQAQASAKQAQVSLENSKNQLSYAQVRAEVSGIVSSCNISSGSTVSAANPALTLIDMDEVKISFKVTGDDINKIHVGDTVYTTVSSISDKPFEAIVSTVAPAADAQTGLYPVEVRINNSDHTLKPGMFATSKLVFNQKTDVIIIPINAVITQKDEKYVFTVDDQQIAHKVMVETGIENDTNVEILSGLSVNDHLVTKGQEFLSDGCLVNVVTSNE